MKNATKKELARGFFLSSHLNRKEIAAQVGITEKTLRKWIDDEGWEDLKELKSITRSELLIQSMEQLKVVNEQIAALDPIDYKGRKILFDSKGILVKEITALSDQPLHQYIGVLNEYIDWVSKTTPENLKLITSTSFEFIEYLNKHRK